MIPAQICLPEVYTAPAAYVQPSHVTCGAIDPLYYKPAWAQDTAANLAAAQASQPRLHSAEAALAACRSTTYCCHRCLLANTGFLIPDCCALKLCVAAG